MLRRAMGPSSTERTGQGAICAVHRAAIWTGVVLIALALGLDRVAADDVVRLYYFYDPDCAACQVVHGDVIAPMMAEHGARVAVEERRVDEPANHALMVGLGRSLGVTTSDIPQVVIGDRVLAGSDAIVSELDALVRVHLARGGVELPTVAPALTPPAAPSECTLCDIVDTSSSAPVEGPRIVRAVLFLSANCPPCDTAVAEWLPPIEAHYGDRLEVLTADVSRGSDREIWMAAMDARAVPAERRTAPMVFVGDHVLTAADTIAEELPGIIDRYLVEGGRDLPDDLTPLVAAPSEPERTPSIAGAAVAAAGGIAVVTAMAWMVARRGRMRR